MTRKKESFVLRKYRGRFDAALVGSMAHVAGAPRGSNAFGAFGNLLSAMAPLLMVVLALVALFAFGQVHHASHVAALSPLALGGLVVGETVDVTKKIEAIGTAFEQFKAANDDRLKEIEKKGVASAETEAKVNAANADITKLSNELKEMQAQLRDVETVSARIKIGGAEAVVAERKEAQQFFAIAQGRKRNAQVSDADVETYRGYKSAFETYCRMGKATPADVRAALSTGSGPDGGYWVPADTTGRIVTRLIETSPMRKIASVASTSRQVVEGGTDLGDTDSGWVAEMDDRDDDSDTPQIGEWSINVSEQYSQPRATQNDLDDSEFDVEAWLARKVGDKMSRVENTSFVLGDGIKKPRGFLDYPTAAAAAWGKVQYIKSGAAAGYAAAAPGDALVDLVYTLRSDLRQGALFVMNTLSLAATRKLKDGDGNYLLIPDFANAAKPTLLGYAVEEFADMPDIAANAYPVAFGNFREAYQIYDRQGIRVLRDPITKKGWVKFYTTKRVGGDVINFDALKLLKMSA